MHHGEQKTVTLVAGTDLSALQYRIIGTDGDLAATAAEAIGVLVTKPQSGEHCSAAYAGHMKGVAGGAVTKGNRLTVSASGFLTAYTPTSADFGAAGVGKALSTVASGEVVNFIGDFSVAGAG